MEIGLINAYSTLNLGDAAIYSAFQCLLPAEHLITCLQDEKPDQSIGITFLHRFPSDCHAYISVGGDIFNNSREWFVTKTFLQNLQQLRRAPARTILFGQSIPRSCHGVSFLLLRECLRRLAVVCVRDVESYSRLRRVGVDTKLSFDVAFVLKCSDLAQEIARRQFSQQGLDPSLAAVLSVREFDGLYGHSNGHFVRNMIGLCHSLQAEGRVPVVLIQSRAYGPDNDLDVSRILQEHVPGIVVFNPFLDNLSVPTWQLAMAVFSMVDLVLAVRFHTAVLALAAGRIPYHIYYSNKGKDLCDRLGLPGCDLRQFNPASAFPSIMATRGGRFDHEALRRRVCTDFYSCFQKVRLPKQPLTCYG